MTKRQIILKSVLESIHERFGDIFKKTFKRNVDDEQQQTVLAAVVLLWGNIQTINRTSDESQAVSFEVASIGSGTKSIGRKAMENKANCGGVVHDSHAEVLARRGFKLFIAENLKNQKYFQINEEDGKYIPTFQVMFYTSQTPCGAASMAEQEKQQQITKEDGENKMLFQNTGAKYYGFLFDNKYQPEKDDGRDILRVKPGRSDLPVDCRSCSLSCSDKMMLWNVVGLQGALIGEQLSRLIYIDYLFVESAEGSNRPMLKARILHAIDVEKRLNGQEQSVGENYNAEEQLLCEEDGEQQQSEEGGIIADQISVKKHTKKLIRKSIKLNIPKLILTKRIKFQLNRQLSDSKPKYLDQHIAMVAGSDASGAYKLEIVNGSKGHKWGMGDKGATIKKNFPMLSKYAFFKAITEQGIVSASNYHSAKCAANSIKVVKKRMMNRFHDSIIDKRAQDDFEL